jgi:hypothetical protein
MTFPLPARRPAGPAAGALAGRYGDDLAIGTPLVMGPCLFDDFIRPPAGGYYGDLLWGLHNFAGAPTATNQTPTADTELGITRLSTGAAAAREGAAIGYGDGTDRQFYRAPPIGSLFAVKLRAVDVSQIEIASGFFEQHAAVSSPTANDFIGIRGTAGGNWLGVIRNGTTESTVDLSLAVDTTWRVVGFERLADGTIQFCRWDRSTHRRVVREDIGQPVSVTNLPDAALTISPLNVITLDGTDKAAEIDFVSLGGRTER